MSKVYTGSEAISQAKGLMKCNETKIIITTTLHEDESTVVIYEFLGDYYFSSIGKRPELAIFEKITKEEADNIVYNIKGLSNIGTYFEFGGF